MTEEKTNLLKKLDQNLETIVVCLGIFLGFLIIFALLITLGMY